MQEELPERNTTLTYTTISAAAILTPKTIPMELHIMTNTAKLTRMYSAATQSTPKAQTPSVYQTKPQ